MSSDEADLGTTVTAGDATPPPGASAVRLERGSSLGRYTIVEVLGEGGMGVVYGAYDPDLDRKVALKLLRVPAGRPASSEARARLLGEARAMAKLSHPNVITIYEVGTVGDRDFLAMEFVDGVSLAEWLDEPHDWRDVVRVFRRAGAGLAAAHRAGLVHRDFKPGNVLLGRDGRVLVTDFGLAREQAPWPDEGGETADAQAAETEADREVSRLEGTPAYMAPELTAGAPADARSDQFAFCVALHEALYGRRPFAGETVEELREVMSAGRVPEEPKGSSVPSRLRRAALRGLSPDPDARHPSMSALLAALRHDPALMRRRLAALGVVALTGAAIALLLSGGGRDRDADACSDADRNWEGVWDEHAKVEIGRVFSAAGPGARDSLRGLERALDEYKRQWSEIYADTCTATRVRRVRSEEDFHLHMGCLLDRRNQVRSLIDVFLRADADTVEHAVQAAQSLPRLDECYDLEALRSGLPPPEDPETRKKVDDLRAELGHLKALQETMLYTQALERASSIVERARATGYGPVKAEALYRLGSLYLHTGQAKKARAALEEAVILAEEAAHDEIRARAMVGLLQASAFYTSDHDATRKLGRRAMAAVARYGGDDTLEARAEAALANVSLEEGNYDETIERLETAAQTYDRALGADNLRAAEVRRRIAVVYRLRGDDENALAVQEKALQVIEGHLGADHPRVARAAEAVGAALRSLGKYDASREYFARARRFWETPRGREVLDATAGEQPCCRDRRVIGRVIGEDGKPVAGAEVVAGEYLSGDGKYLDAMTSASEELYKGIVRARSEADGSFALRDVSRRRLYLGADAGLRGRSVPVAVPEGKGGETVTLRLRPVGGIRGTVHTSEEIPPLSMINAFPEQFRTANRLSIDAPVNDKGEFEFERMAAGEYVLLASLAGYLRQTVIKAAKVTVRPGQVTEVDFDIDSEDIDLDVVVRGEQGARLDGAQLFLFDGDVKATGSEDLLDELTTRAQKRTVRIALARQYFPRDREMSAALRSDRHAEFQEVGAGRHSVCVLPIGGELKDPDFRRRLYRHVEDLDIHCRPATVVPGEKQQRVIIEVPPMKPLPRPIQQP